MMWKFEYFWLIGIVFWLKYVMFIYFCYVCIWGYIVIINISLKEINNNDFLNIKKYYNE